MKTSTAGIAVAALVGLGGCASNIVHEGKYAQEEGWRKGTVVEIGPAKSLTRPSLYDCRAKTSGTEGNDLYVVVAFLRNGHPYARNAKLPANALLHADAQLRVGDKVYVNINDCNAPLPKRSS